MTILSSTKDAVSLQEHFTDAVAIQKLMCDLLGDVNGKSLLEPAVGQGALLRSLIGKPSSIDAVDVNLMSLEKAKVAQPHQINAIHADFIDLFVVNPIERHSILKTQYDTIIANPPFGLKMSIEYRKAIKRTYPNVYARESYGLFLHFSLQLLRPGGRYVFILPDTFIHSVNHKPLRKELLRIGAPTHIIQFPSRYFETVNFGYANLCVIAGNARELSPSDQVSWLDATKAPNFLSDKLTNDAPQIAGAELFSTLDDGWLHPHQKRSLNSMKQANLLGDIAECRTGIYSGDNKRFFGFDNRMLKVRGAGHPIKWDQDVTYRELSDDERRNGIRNGARYVPLIKGGHRKPIEATQWAIDWGEEAVSFYRTDKKARLQNSQFYFRQGLGVPMVTSGRISCSIFSNSIFDQGVVGIFPNNSDDLQFLLIYLNSDFVAKLKRSINASSNNSANYVKKLPVPMISENVRDQSKDIILRATQFGWDFVKDEARLLVKDVTTQDTI